ISVVSTFINYSVYRASFFTKVLISPLFPFFFLLHLFAHIEVFVLRKGRDQKYYLGVTVFAQKVS
ncbi:MAG: hypothetical protein NZ480_08320, partial [Bdellovibrionaceae bacterium]|nr:hypothetical protein [Pseudobdellovibrionaceae bacterium]